MGVLDETFTFGKFQLTHPSRGVTQVFCVKSIQFSISTHTPLARCDLAKNADYNLIYGISTHTPLARCDSCAV